MVTNRSCQQLYPGKILQTTCMAGQVSCHDIVRPDAFLGHDHSEAANDVLPKSLGQACAFPSMTTGRLLISIYSEALAEDVTLEYLEGKRGYAGHCSCCPCHEAVVLHACSACPRCLVHTHASKRICSFSKCVFASLPKWRWADNAQSSTTEHTIGTQQMD